MADKNIDNIINEYVGHLASDSALSVGHRTNQELKAAEERIRSLKSRIVVNDRRILSALALEVQDTVPVSASFTRGSCHFTYKSRDMQVSIDWTMGKWDIEGNRLMHRRFIREASAVPLTDEGLTQLAKLIADYFSGRYKSLQSSGEEPEGDRIDLDEIMTNG